MNESSTQDHVVDSACLNRCLLEFTTRKFYRFVLKNFKILKLCGFEIKMLYFDDTFEIQQLKMISTVRKTKQRIQLSQWFPSLDPFEPCPIVQFFHFKNFEEKEKEDVWTILTRILVILNHDYD